jgi:wyosine [tRNA(Phe)-imidazoG37] synthetase (radical SAM superfamily)
VNQTRSLNLFTSHPRSWRDHLYVYPVVSRRSKGLSIGVNLNPDKICNFDCIYCSVDRTEPPTVTRVDLEVLRDELTRTIALLPDEIWKHPPFDQNTPDHLRRFNDVAFSGDGEPTSFPQFETACGLVAEVLHQFGWSDSVKIVVITNATLFHHPPVQRALRFLDRHNGEIWAKLDAGTDAYYHLVERTKIPLRSVLRNILACGRERPIIIQSLFMNVHAQPPPQQEIDAYVERLRELQAGGCQIKLVQVYTVARQTAEAYVTPLEAARLDAITDRVRALGLAAETFYGPG